MLRKFSSNRSLEDNIKLGSLTAFSAGMVNIASLLIFFAFTSNVTGHYAILAAEIVKGNMYQIAVVFAWIFLFFFGSFVANIIVINFNQRNAYFAHSTPIVLEIICLLIVGVYGDYFYKETLTETEILLSLMMFAMGLQNGLTASISNFAVKTTHLTGTTTDLGILFSMFTQKQFRKNKELTGKAKLLLSIAVAYLAGAVFAGLAYFHMEFKMFYIVCAFLVVVIVYDVYKLRLMRFLNIRTKQERFILLRPSNNDNNYSTKKKVKEVKEELVEETASN
jgi:uncharacterized membrane protein YoaK (UPF0700 family)